MQVYIEPVIPTPHLTVVGRSPMAHTLADLARALGWRAEVARRAGLLRGRPRRPLGRRGRHPGPRRRGGGRAGGVGVPGVRRPGRLPPARRGGARLPGRPRRRRATCSTGSTCRSGWTSATPRTARSPWRSWPSWCSCGPRASSRRRATAAPARRAGRGARPGLRHDGARRRVQPPVGARRRHVLLLLRRLPGRLRPGPARLPHHPGGLMLIKSGFEVAQPVDKVWRFFDDIPQVAACLPGAELTDDLGDDRYHGQGRHPDGAGQAAVRRHRPDQGARRRRPSASSSTPPGPTRRAGARPPCWSPRAWSPARGGTRVDVDPGPATVRRRRAVRPRHDLRRHRDPDARLRHQHAGPHRRHRPGPVARPGRRRRGRPAASPSPCGRCGWRSAACSRRFFLPYRPNPS